MREEPSDGSRWNQEREADVTPGQVGLLRKLLRRLRLKIRV